jgi:hypothetical protein
MKRVPGKGIPGQEKVFNHGGAAWPLIENDEGVRMKN